jgi:hypothetical protein
MKMFSWILGNRSSRLNPIEAQIIEALASALNGKAGDLLRSQVALINKVQRLDQDREVDFYHIEKGKPMFPDIALFPNQSEEFELAKLKVTDVATGHQTKAIVSVVRGHLFCIEFSHTPRDLRGAKDLKIEIEYLANPL